MKKKDVFLSTVKGFITGIIALLPGISPASIIISLNAYDNVIESLNGKSKKNALKLVTIPLLIGIIIGLFAGSRLTNYLWNNCRLQTILLFVGLVIGGNKIYTKSKDLIINGKTIIVFIITVIISLMIYFILKDRLFLINSNNIINVMLLGVITGMSLLIPAISMSSIHTVGKHNYIIEAFNNISKGSNILIVIVFIFIVIISLLLVGRLISLLIKKDKNTIYTIISALMLSNVVISLLHIDKIVFNFITIFTSILAFMWGYILSKNIINE